MIPSPLSQFGPWPSDLIDQRMWMNRMGAYLTDLYNYIQTNAADVVIVYSDTPPDQPTWESEYENQTGKTLPIPPNATLIWWNTTDNTLGGVFGTTWSDPTVQNRATRFAPGNVVALKTAIQVPSLTVGQIPIGTRFTGSPSVTFTTPVITDVEVYITAGIGFSGANPVGVDIWMDGAKVGTEVFQIPVDGTLLTLTSSGTVSGRFVLEAIPPGNHQVELLIGYAGAPIPPLPNITIGGPALGATQLYIRAVAR